ncbi:MAG TPA: hypothetical protein VKR58_07220 [Aquella sp.]|nr:hypothetical protein [Aquella sp.]
MSKEQLKNVYCQVSLEVQKKLKIMAIQKEMTLPELIKSILEKSVANKKIEEVELN